MKSWNPCVGNVGVGRALGELGFGERKERRRMSKIRGKLNYLLEKKMNIVLVGWTL